MCSLVRQRYSLKISRLPPVSHDVLIQWPQTCSVFAMRAPDRRYYPPIATQRIKDYVEYADYKDPASLGELAKNFIVLAFQTGGTGNSCADAGSDTLA